MSKRFARLQPHLSLAMAQAKALHQCDQQAADIVQTVLERALTSANFPDDSDHLKAWFLRSVRNASIDVLRRDAKHKVYESSYRQAAYGGHDVLHNETLQRQDPERKLVDQQRALLVNEALQRLTFDTREILIMREVNDCSYAEIAQILEIELGTVMSRLHRARLALKLQLEKVAGEL